MPGPLPGKPYAVCDKCKASYLYGTPHICANNDRKASEEKLEEFLTANGHEFTLEHE